ncbi:hypothetical protein B0J18DRAFT_453422 [Chaetomium sp. MPI-SDFR-AT-0129]|nr:hypothetical protein B0J18DRAFT_453422 [Chaetomium sp. MPI-SDFR-AT-0129]
MINTTVTVAFSAGVAPPMRSTDNSTKNKTATGSKQKPAPSPNKKDNDSQSRDKNDKAPLSTGKKDRASPGGESFPPLEKRAKEPPSLDGEKKKKKLVLPMKPRPELSSGRVPATVTKAMKPKVPERCALPKVAVAPRKEPMPRYQPGQKVQTNGAPFVYNHDGTWSQHLFPKPVIAVQNPSVPTIPAEAAAVRGLQQQCPLTAQLLGNIPVEQLSQREKVENWLVLGEDLAPRVGTVHTAPSGSSGSGVTFMKFSDGKWRAMDREAGDALAVLERGAAAASAATDAKNRNGHDSNNSNATNEKVWDAGVRLPSPRLPASLTPSSSSVPVPALAPSATPALSPIPAPTTVPGVQPVPKPEPKPEPTAQTPAPLKAPLPAPAPASVPAPPPARPMSPNVAPFVPAPVATPPSSPPTPVASASPAAAAVAPSTATGTTPTTPPAQAPTKKPRTGTRRHRGRGRAAATEAEIARRVEEAVERRLGQQAQGQQQQQQQQQQGVMPMPFMVPMPVPMMGMGMPMGIGMMPGVPMGMGPMGGYYGHGCDCDGDEQRNYY